jgi:hypothetical protein
MGLTVSLLLIVTVLVSWLWYVEIIVTTFLSLHLVTETGPEFCAIISPFFLSFVSFTFFEHFFSSVSVFRQSVLCTVFNILARQDELWKLSIHTIRPCFNRGSTSFRTVGVSCDQGESSSVSLPAYTRKDQMYPVIASHSSQVLVPNLDAFRGRYSLKDRRLSKASLIH